MASGKCERPARAAVPNPQREGPHLRALWHRSDGTPAKKAYSIVAEKRQVSQRTVETAVREHRVAVQAVLKAHRADLEPIEPAKHREQIEVLIQQQAAVFGAAKLIP